MGYNDGEALILTRVQACDYFSAANTSRGDWKILNSGHNDHYAILRPGAVTIQQISHGQYAYSWITMVEVWQRYTDEVESKSNLCARLVNLLAMLNYPHLGSSTIVQDAVIEGADEPQIMSGQDGGVTWLRWVLRIRWTEEAVITYAE